MLSVRTFALNCCGWLLLSGLAMQPCGAQTPPAAQIYLIGNSLTWDTLPGLLAGDVQWHVDCGKNLKFIYDHPDAPCVKTSTLWPVALQGKQYTYLCVQPHFGTTLEEDVSVIMAWLKMQPDATLVLHTGWNRAVDFETHFHAVPAGNQMVHAPQYFDDLQAELLKRDPEREIRCTRAMHVLDEIYHDIEQGQAPFDSFEELYRDSIHMTTDAGRYLMHNLMRIALQQPLSDQGFQIDAAQKEYLTRKLHAVQARSAAAAGS